MWLDAIEVKTLTNALQALTPSTHRDIHDMLRNQQHFSQTQDVRNHKAVTCPRDNSPLHEHVYATDSGVMIHHCTTCAGVWLDGGELFAVAQYLQPNARDYLAELILAEQKNTATALQGIKAMMFFPARLATYLASPVAILGEIVYFIFVFTENEELHKKRL